MRALPSGTDQSVASTILVTIPSIPDRLIGRYERIIISACNYSREYLFGFVSLLKYKQFSHKVLTDSKTWHKDRPPSAKLGDSLESGRSGMF